MEKASDILFSESLTFLSRDSRISEYIAGEILSRHLSLIFSCRTSVKMINSPNLSPPPLYRIFDNSRMSASLSWASPTNTHGVFLLGSGFLRYPLLICISVFSPAPPSPAPPLCSRRRSATFIATTRQFPSLPRFSIHQEEEDDKAAPRTYIWSGKPSQSRLE